MAAEQQATYEQGLDEEGKFLRQMVDLDYKIVSSPIARYFGEQMQKGRIVGHRCPECSKVYVPPRGYCPLCTVLTGDQDEVEVADTGIVTSFTVITPIQYRGQEEKDDYVLASILLDGASTNAGQQRITGIPIDDVHTGLRVKAVWAPEGERGGFEGGRGFGLGNAITSWEPTGEPDAPREEYQDHIL